MRWTTSLRFCLLACAVVLGTTARAGGALSIPVPEVRDPQLQLQLFAAEPDIVTPIGAAVDARGRLFVIESHTHMPPASYRGPRFDRIKVFEDTNRDGRADRITVFAEDLFRDAMNIAFGPDGRLYVATQSGVWALADTNNDGRADKNEKILKLETKQTYAHSGGLGVVVSHDGWVYFSRGNIAGYSYAYVGTDGSRINGYGDGGDIVRCRMNGSQVERIATGFWNPFDLRIDAHGRLLAIDNDPDSRGPNRLLHIVPGGDYGYKTRYGQNGLHPFNGWAGELPGTLPFIAGVGESPSGLLDANSSSLPPGYKDNALVTIWAENSIERFRLQPSGVSLTSKREVLIKGNRDFRPVGIVSAPDGTVYITDWVKKDYPNHGLGRIWRLTAKTGVGRMRPRPTLAPPQPDAGTKRLESLLALDRASDHPTLKGALLDEDPFVRAVAARALSRPVFRPQLGKDLRDRDARVRLGALLAMRWGSDPALPLPKAPPGALSRLLADPDHDVRLMALLWAAETMDLSLAPRLRAAITSGKVSPILFRFYLAATQLLTPAEVKHLAARTPRSTATEIGNPAVVERLLRDRKLAPAIHAMALPFLGAPKTPQQLALVRGLVGSGDLAVRIEAVRALASSDDAQVRALLATTARDRRLPASVRGEALTAIASRPADLAAFADLLDDNDRAVQLPAARLFRLTAADPKVKAALERKLTAVKSVTEPDATQVALTEALIFALTPEKALEEARRPRDLAGWQNFAGQGGDAAAGRFVFAHPMVACTRCHSVNARGGQIGPDLTHIASSVDRARLVESIVNPSDEVSPEFQAYTVKKKDGEVLIGSQFHFRGTDRVSLRLIDGTDVVLALADVESYEFADTSFMPGDLDKAMTPSEFRDLIAYLASLK